MRRFILSAVFVGVLLGSGTMSSSAQDGIVIQNNGVDSSHSAAGADNVNISRADGNSASNNGSGANNEVRTVNREERNRNRKDRSERTSDEVSDVAPAEGGEWVPEDSGAYEAYADESSDWTEPVAAPENLVAEVQPAPDPSGTLPIQLPNTGTGLEDTLPLAAFAAGIFAAASGTESLRRRLLR
ncbi:MAG: hypothetical protein KC442_04655 [Thermomicrobiales bacterium]|nr:hypothetical protein [Thermomicrobiales bacterium]